VSELQSKNSRLVKRLFMAVIGMFAFGFAMVPLYSLVCDVTGINSAGSSASGRMTLEEAMHGGVDADRLVTVEFDITMNEGLPWTVAPAVKKMQVHPGKVYEVVFTAENLTAESVITQAVPGVTPWQATEHFNKIECFCFSQQTLKPHEVKQMPLRFVLDKRLPDKYSVVTLSYSFMNTDREAVSGVSDVNKQNILNKNLQNQI